MEIALDTMTVPEKLRLMEALWADLSRHADTLELPAWHAQALRETERRVAEGKETALDWEPAKRQLRAGFRCLRDTAQRCKLKSCRERLPK
jgi:hypothetical protein